MGSAIRGADRTGESVAEMAGSEGIVLMAQPQAHCHKMVAEVAKAAAHELYDTLMGDNVLYTEWKRQNPGATDKILLAKFVARNWGKCIPFARATLARMLTTAIDDGQKTAIHEALVLDNMLVRGRRSAAELAQPNLIQVEHVDG